MNHENPIHPNSSIFTDKELTLPKFDGRGQILCCGQTPAEKELFMAEHLSPSSSLPTGSVRLIYRLIAVGCVLFVMLTFAAMASYPGGSQFDPDATGYRFFENFYSDLGNTVTPRGASNLVSVVLFAVAMSVAGLAVAGFFFVFRSLLSGTWRGRALGNIAAFLGIFSAVGFAGVGFTPCNLWPYMHWICANVSFRILLLAVAVDSVALGLDRDTPRTCLWIFAGFGLLLAGYILLLKFGPSMSTPTGRVVQVASQKVIIYSSILSIGVQTLIADRMFRQSRVSVPA